MNLDLADDFDGFYHANFGDTVAMTYAYTADLGAAQDIAQEAFCRAWIPVSCGQLGSLEYLERSVLVVEARRDATLHSLGWTGRDGGQALGAWIEQQVLYLDARPHPGAGRGWVYELGTVQAFRWTGSTFDNVDSNVSYPPLLPTRDGTRLDLTPVAGRLTSCDGLPPRSEVRPTGSKSTIEVEVNGPVGCPWE